jgi:putative endonuclease
LRDEEVDGRTERESALPRGMPICPVRFERVRIEPVRSERIQATIEDMNDHRRRLGQWGENVASLHLEEKGYRIIAKNWRCQFGEIDLIAQDGDEVAFIEVKTRQGRAMGLPEEGLTEKKSQKLIELAQIYIAENDIDPDWRIDLVAVELDDQGTMIRCEHIVSAVLGW